MAATQPGRRVSSSPARWLVGLGLAALAAWLLGRGAVRPARRPPERIPYTDVNPYGANFFLDREVEAWKLEKTLQMARAAGIGWAKQQFSWEEIEPRQKGQFDWAKYDRIVELAEEHGLQIIARLDRPPPWTRRPDQLETQPPEDLDDYGDFVYAFVDRYRGRVRYVQIWNEPNLTAEWGFQRVDAVAYTRLLEVAYRRAKEADPNVAVLSAPLAITLEDASMRGNHNDLIFLEQMYQAGAGRFFDVLSANAFGLDRPPEDPPDPAVLNFRRVELQRAVMERYGDAAKPIWINEYGWNAAPASFADDLLTWERVTPAQQADYTVSGITWARANWPWLGVVNIWYFRQVGDILPDRPVYYFALVDPEFNPQPAYEAVLRAAAGAGLARTGWHEDTSAAVSALGWTLELDPQASAGTRLVSNEPNGSLSLSFEGADLSLLTTVGPDEGRLWVEVDGAAPSGLRRDATGRAYVELESEGTEVQALVPLARSLAEGVHRLSVRPAGSEQVTVDAFLVASRSPAAPVSLLALVGALSILLGVALRRRR